MVKSSILSIAKRITSDLNLEYDKISIIHGRIYQVISDYGVIKIIPMYHPAVATYNPKTKDILVKDFKVLKNISKINYIYT